MSPLRWPSKVAKAVVARRFEAADPGAVRQAGDAAADQAPFLAVVFGDLDVAVVGADPDHLLVQGRLTDCEDRAVILGGGVVDRQTP
jgi:hypothetical protein